MRLRHLLVPSASRLSAARLSASRPSASRRSEPGLRGAAGLALGLCLLAAPLALALMPPHTTRAEPGEGGELKGRAIVFHGYSLDYADKVATALDVEAKRPVATTVEVHCEWVGKGDCAGCRQQQCQATVTLAAVERDHHYKVEFLDTTVTVKATTTEGAAPAKGEPPAPGDAPKADPPKADAPKADAPKAGAPAKRKIKKDAGSK